MTISRGTKYLEKHGGQWRVSLPVPKRFQQVIGKTRLKKPLGTTSLSVANRLKEQVIADLREHMRREQELRRGGRLALLRQAFQFGQEIPDLDPVERPDQWRVYYDAAAEIANGLLMLKSIESYYDEEDEEYVEYEVYTPESERLSKEYLALALGNGEVPIDLFYTDYVAQLRLKPKTLGDDKLAIDTLREWCQAQRIPFIVESITTKIAKEFASGLSAFRSGIQPVTVQKYIFRLVAYWEYLTYLEYTELNPWRAVKVKVPATPYREEERAFTASEVVALLAGPAPEELHDLMLIALLTGARIDPIVDLQVGDIHFERGKGLFQFKPQKGEQSERYVPIHPDLLPIVERRIAEKHPSDDFFPEWPRRPAKSKIARSAEASKRFTRYRRALGVDERIEGNRRSRINFHSFRRWFITEAERNNFNGNLIAAIVGHKSPGLTLGRYSEGPAEKQARKCVNATKVPVAGQNTVNGVRSRLAKSSTPAEANAASA